MAIHRLDLGGTACYEDPDAVNISLDASDSGDETTPMIQADYNHAPFPSNTFDEALGSCYLEEKVDWRELHRIMKPGAHVTVKCCGRPYIGPKSLVREAKAAGFKMIEAAGFYYEAGSGWTTDNPFIFEKET
jgi:hypothetical protein